MMNVDKTQIDVNGNIIEPEEFGFNLICEKCGSSRTRLIPTSHYTTGYKIPDMITMHLMCANCHHEIEYVIYRKRSVGV